MAHSHRGSLVRDALVATAGVVGLYGLAQGVQFQPVRVPGYLLVVGFDALEGVFGSAGSSYRVLFAAYLVGLGVAAGTAAHFVRTWSNEAGLPSWRVGLAGTFALVGALSLAFATAILFGTAQLGPVFVAGTTGVVLLGLAGWLVGVVTVPGEPSER